MDLAAAFLIWIYSAIEGLREYYFYLVNKSGKFPNRPADKRRKKVNATLFGIFSFTTYLMLILPDVSFQEDAWYWFMMFLKTIIFGLFSMIIRWWFLDGVLNIKRNKNFFYVGSVSDIDILLLRISFKINKTSKTVSILIKSIALIVIITLYAFF